MSQIITDIGPLGLKEAFKLLLLWLLWAAYLNDSPRRGELLRWLLAGAVAAAAVSAAVMAGVGAQSLRPWLVQLVGYVFFLFFATSIIGLFAAAVTMPAALERIAGPGIAALIALYLVPDILSAAVYLRDTGVMRASPASTYAAFAAGFALPWLLLALRPMRLAGPLSRFLGTGQLMLMMALIKLTAGGISGLSEFSLIPTVERGAMKFTHDVLHQVLVFLLVPDHPMLTLTTWKFIGIFFGSNFGLSVALALLAGPAAVYLYSVYVAPVPGVDEAATGAHRRILRAEARRTRLKLSAAAMVFVAVVLASWISASSRGEVSILYAPAPKPVVEDKGSVVIPLTDPTMDLRDGKIHKFVIMRPEGEVRFFVMKKPDDKLAVCLDACEICPPEGYGQSTGFVVCMFCRTPISTSTLGRPGGCNPIPLKAEINDRDIRIQTSEIDARWADARSGGPKGGER